MVPTACDSCELQPVSLQRPLFTASHPLVLRTNSLVHCPYTVSKTWTFLSACHAELIADAAKEAQQHHLRCSISLISILCT